MSDTANKQVCGFCQETNLIFRDKLMADFLIVLQELVEHGHSAEYSKVQFLDDKERVRFTSHIDQVYELLIYDSAVSMDDDDIAGADHLNLVPLVG